MSEALNITVEMSNWGNATFQSEGSVVESVGNAAEMYWKGQENTREDL